MTTEKKSNNSVLKQGLLGFVITFSLTLIILTLHYLYNYSDHLLYKNFDFSIILKFAFYGLISMVALSLPISVLAMTTVYYRQLLRQGQKTIKFKNGLLFSIPISIVCFIWLSFVSPINNLHSFGLLYDIRLTAPDEPIKHTDIEVFNGNPMTSNYFQIGNAIDSLATEQSLFSEEDYYSEETAQYYYKRITKEINKWEIKRAEMVSFPFQIFILFYFGLFLGILNRNNKFVYIGLGVCFLILPSFYNLSVIFRNLAQKFILNPMTAQFLYLLILAIFTFGLFLLAKWKVRDVNYCWYEDK